MDESEFRSLAKWQISVPPRYSENRIQYLLKAEEQILQSISVRTPISKVLNDICNALDCEIGSMVSLICMPDDNASSGVKFHIASHSLVCIVSFAQSSGLGMVKIAGSLEMYCCVSRKPSPREFQLIERAVCLAAAAIKRYREAIEGGNCCVHGVRSARTYVPETPTLMN
jgi:hypothetical protein